MYFARFGLVKTRNERFIIILGGFDAQSNGCDDIYIYDTNNNLFSQSKISCPAKSGFYATISNDPEGDELITFGFINDCYKSNNFQNVQVLPFYLIQLISHWLCIQEIYLLQYGVKGGGHWKIDVDDILQSIK